MNRLFALSLLTMLFTWILLVIGGLVNPMGASMACPDWFFFPTCNGEIFPVMKGGVLYEHGHRLAASVVGIFTVFLTVSCLRSICDKKTKQLACLALFLVILQGTLGGITVLLNLSALVSTLHLVFGMLFFSLLVIISFKLSPKFKPMPLFEKSQTFMFLAIMLTLLQLVLGGVVRHLGAGMACGDDLLGCGPVLWPTYFLGQLHMSHRFFGYALFFVVIYASAKSRALAVSRGDNLVKKLSILPVFITFCQIALGLMTIHTIRSAHVVATHTGFGALLLASLLVVYLLNLGSVGVQQPNRAQF